MQSPARVDGGPQHAPVLRESTMALIESVGPLLSSVPPHRQQEDRGRKAPESPTPRYRGLIPLRAIASPLVFFVDWIVPYTHQPPCVTSDTRLT